ncbi:MAG TPA: DUF4373 domain-containing protein [Cytophagaceae bacterium]|jgi:hypothetical protein
MAGAKIKEGLDYFPTSTRKDNRFKIIRALHGFEGHVILETLLQDIHGDKGYYVKWTERLAKIFASENGFQLNLVLETVKDCLVEGIFNEEHFGKYSILTSEDIQKVWINVVKERKEIIYLKDYILIDLSEYLKKEKSMEVKEDETRTYPTNSSSKDVSKSLKVVIPGINSINPPVNSQDNSINPSDISTSKQVKQLKEEEQLEQQKEFLKEKIESEAFSLAAENFYPFEKNQILFEKIKKEFNGENIVGTVDQPPKEPEEVFELETEKSENRNLLRPKEADLQLQEKVIAGVMTLNQESQRVLFNEVPLDVSCQDFEAKIPPEFLQCEIPNEGIFENRTAQKQETTESETLHVQNGEFLGEKTRNFENWNWLDRESAKMGKTESPPHQPGNGEYGRQDLNLSKDHPNLGKESNVTSTKPLKKLKNKPVKRLPHPARSEIVKAWEEKFAQPYQNSYAGNLSIIQIISHLEKLIILQAEFYDEHDKMDKIIELWKMLLAKWEQMGKFYQNLIAFESIARHLPEIINQIKTNGNPTNSKFSKTTSGAKPSFERFWTAVD